MASIASNAPTVLLIDYDPRSMRRLRALLALAGCQTIIARDGRAGVSVFARLLPDLVIVQDLLPRRHGFEVCRAIKESVAGRRRPVVLLASASRGSLPGTGCDAHLRKPFGDAEFRAVIGRLLPSRSTGTRRLAIHRTPARLA